MVYSTILKLAASLVLLGTILNWSELSTAEEASRIARPYLYEVRKGQSVSWLLGTYHVGVPYRDVAHVVDSKLKASRLVFLELFNPERFSLWANNPIAAILSSSENDLKAGDPLSPAAKLKLIRDFRIPAVLAEQIYSKSCSTFAEAIDMNQSRLDLELYFKAKRMRKKFAALDTDELRAEADRMDRANFELRYGATATCDVETEFLARTTLSELKRHIAIHVARYRSGKDYQGEERSSRYPGLAHRNDVWMTKLVPALNQGRVFVAVGVGHLGGPRGLIAQLTKAGFTVNRVE